MHLLIVSDGSGSPTYVPTLSYIIQSSPEDDAEMATWMVMEALVCLSELMCAFDHSVGSCPLMIRLLPWPD